MTDNLRTPGGLGSLIPAVLLTSLVTTALAQTARIEGQLFDAVTHRPLSDTRVILTGSFLPAPPSQEATTDARGRFTFARLRGGAEYALEFLRQGYPGPGMGRVRKTVQVDEDAIVQVRMELLPGASLSGHLLDETGNPLQGCTVSPQPVDIFRSRVTMVRGDTQADGSYRIADLYPGEYWLVAQCRPYRPGSPPPGGPVAAKSYPVAFFPQATRRESAETVLLAPGEERSALDIRMLPVPLTEIRGRFAPGSAPWRDRKDLIAILSPLGPHDFTPSGYESAFDTGEGAFVLRGVPPGSYRLQVFSRNSLLPSARRDAGSIAGETRVDVAGLPIDVLLELRLPADVSGTLSLERGTEPYQQLDPSEIQIHLVPRYSTSPAPPPVPIRKDGSFLIPSVPAGQWRISLANGATFVKSATYGNEPLRDGDLDLTSGAIRPLWILASTNTGSIHGTAPPESWLLYARLDGTGQAPPVMAIKVGGNGTFVLPGLHPGTYHVNLGDPNGVFPSEGAVVVGIHEGEKAAIELPVRKR